MKIYLWIQILMCVVVILAKTIYLSKNKYPRIEVTNHIQDIIVLEVQIAFGIWAFVLWLNY